MEWKKVWSKMPVWFVEKNFEYFFSFFFVYLVWQIFKCWLTHIWRRTDSLFFIYFCCKFSWSICLQGLFWRLRHSIMIQTPCTWFLKSLVLNFILELLQKSSSKWTKNQVQKPSSWNRDFKNQVQINKGTVVLRLVLNWISDGTK